MAIPTRFGQRLRAWRKRRGLSQLDLALAAVTTPRYVSFIETGRSRPGRGVVLRIGDALGLSLADQNDLLAAARKMARSSTHARCAGRSGWTGPL
ncbi:MAG: helix-turn-helix transcriptional regulator [Proteobacteria bacterium]|nr:helix-turn-helix transcriptional regulator [Pseudomonadota bacterium]